MTDLDDLLRTDAATWRATQRPDRDLDEAVRVAAHPASGPRARVLVLAAAAAVVAISGVTALVVDRTSGTDRPASTGTPSAPSSPSTPISPSSPEPSDVPMLHPSGDGMRTLLASSGRYDRTLRLDPLGKGGELSAVCLGGGTITVTMPGAGGFDLECTGTPSAAALPTLGTRVEITGVSDQLWRVAVYVG